LSETSFVGQCLQWLELEPEGYGICAITLGGLFLVEVSEVLKSICRAGGSAEYLIEIIPLASLILIENQLSSAPKKQAIPAR